MTDRDCSSKSETNGRYPKKVENRKLPFSFRNMRFAGVRVTLAEIGRPCQ